MTCRITYVFRIGLNIILEHMQYSFQNVKQKRKKNKENILQDEFNNAKKTFECDPTNKNASDFNTAKEKLEHFYKKSFKVSSFVHGCDGAGA